MPARSHTSTSCGKPSSPRISLHSFGTFEGKQAIVDFYRPVFADIREEVIFESGRPVNTSLFNYRVPRIQGLPDIRLEFIETRDGIGPFGV